MEAAEHASQLMELSNSEGNVIELLHSLMEWAKIRNEMVWIAGEIMKLSTSSYRAEIYKTKYDDLSKLESSKAKDLLVTLQKYEPQMKRAFEEIKKELLLRQRIVSDNFGLPVEAPLNRFDMIDWGAPESVVEGP